MSIKQHFLTKPIANAEKPTTVQQVHDGPFEKDQAHLNDLVTTDNPKISGCEWVFLHKDDTTRIRSEIPEQYRELHVRLCSALRGYFVQAIESIKSIKSIKSIESIESISETRDGQGGQRGRSPSPGPIMAWLLDHMRDDGKKLFYVLRGVLRHVMDAGDVEGSELLEELDESRRGDGVEWNKSAVKSKLEAIVKRFLRTRKEKKTMTTKKKNKEEVRNGIEFDRQWSGLKGEVLIEAMGELGWYVVSLWGYRRCR